MPCKPSEPITEPVDIEVELSFQYDRLRLIFNNDEEHPFLKGFKQAIDIIIEHKNK